MPSLYILRKSLVNRCMVLVLAMTVSKCQMSMKCGMFQSYSSVSPNVKSSADTYCTRHKLV